MDFIQKGRKPTTKRGEEEAIKHFRPSPLLSCLAICRLRDFHLGWQNCAGNLTCKTRQMHCERCKFAKPLSSISKRGLIWQPPLPATIFEGPSIFCSLFWGGLRSLNVSIPSLGEIIGGIDDDGRMEQSRYCSCRSLRGRRNRVHLRGETSGVFFYTQSVL